jgi:hypothetical protein
MLHTILTQPEVDVKTVAWVTLQPSDYRRHLCDVAAYARWSRAVIAARARAIGQ